MQEKCSGVIRSISFTFLELALLCDIYGSLLSDKQRDAIDLYCNEDYSLAEIAEHTGISRQGVRDQIKHAENQLVTFEENLKLSKKYIDISEKLDILEKTEKVKSSPDLIEILNDIREILYY